MRERSVVVTVLGTRPEAVKLAPVIRAMRAGRTLRPIVVNTGQQRDLVQPVLDVFGIATDLDLGLMRPGQNPSTVVASALAALGPVVAGSGAAAVLVQGDTASTLAGAMAGFYAGVPVAHVEAGLRAGAGGVPFPEEGHRKLVAQIAAMHFAPTEAGRDALRREGIAARVIHVTGNSGVDALLAVDRQLERSPQARDFLALGFAGLDPELPIVLATVHRRENHGTRLDDICEGLRLIARHERAQVVVPLHPHPAVHATITARLAGEPRVHLLAPQGYLEFVWLMRAAALILTDSGGVQEEAPLLGRPMLILRDGTERPEAVVAGVAAIVGTDRYQIAGAARAILRDPAVAAWMSRPLRLHGAGDAGRRIARLLAEHLAAMSTMGDEIDGWRARAVAESGRGV